VDLGLENYSRPLVCKEMNLGPGTKSLDYNARADFIKIKVIDLNGIPIDFAVDLFTKAQGI